MVIKMRNEGIDGEEALQDEIAKFIKETEVK